MTAEEAVGAYMKIFGGFPDFLFMGASEEVIVDAVEVALRTGEEIQAEEEADY